MRFDPINAFLLVGCHFKWPKSLGKAFRPAGYRVVNFETDLIKYL
jgi:hypothetical protein